MTEEQWMKPMKLSRDCRKLLARMGKATVGPTVLYGLDQELCEQALRKVVDPLLDAAGLVPVRIDQYHWFLRELARLYRTRYGRDLAFCLELMMRKWQGFGLSPQAMGILVCEIDRELRILAGETVETPDEEEAAAPAGHPGPSEAESEDLSTSEQGP
jgi:hypothetical protein